MSYPFNTSVLNYVAFIKSPHYDVYRRAVRSGMNGPNE